jgi:hypothetical protein
MIRPEDMARAKQNKVDRPKPASSRFRYVIKEVTQSGLTARDGDAPQRVPQLAQREVEPAESPVEGVELVEDVELAFFRLEQEPRVPREPLVENLSVLRAGRMANDDVEQITYHADFAARMKAVRLARVRRSPDWAAQWLAIEDEYERRCKLARSLLGQGVEDVALHDGHVAELVLTARTFITRGAELLMRAPWVRHLHLTHYREVGSSLFGSELLRGIHSLGLLREALEDEDVDELVKRPHIDGLRWLDLSYNNLTSRSFEKLAICSALAHLEYLGLEGNASVSPVDHIGTDPLDGSVVSTTRTPAGRALEALAGELKWLHAPARYPYSYPPSPLDVAKAP